MKIAVFGASGKTGVCILEQALAAGHQVTAFARDPSKILIQHPNLSILQGSVEQADRVEAAIAGQEAVISVLGVSRNSPKGILTIAAQNIIQLMKKEGILRLVVLTGAGVRDPQDEPNILDQIMKVLLIMFAGDLLRDSEKAAQLILESELVWTLVRVPVLTNGSKTGKYRVGYLGRNAGMSISRQDVADFILKQLTDAAYPCQAPVVTS